MALSAAMATACDSGSTQPAREVRLSIDGAGTLNFGAVASQVQLTTTISVSEGVLPRVPWRSTSSGVATISETGLLVSAGDGTTKIIASADQASDTVTVVVTQIPAQLGFEFEPANAAVNIPLLFPVSVFIADSNGICRAAWERTHRTADRKSTRLNSSHTDISRMPSSA